MHTLTLGSPVSRSNALPAAPAWARWRAGCLALAAGLTLGLAPLASAQWDDFSSGTDAGWTHYDPLSVLFGPMVSYTVVNQAYRIQTAIPPVPDAGPGRGGSFRMEKTYTNFYVSVDLVGWDDAARQVFGVAARITTPGLGTTAGYLFNYDRSSGTNGGDFDLSRITNEQADQIQTGPSAYHLMAGRSYRLVFVGKGPYLDAYVYELPQTNTPVLHLAGMDTTYASGVSGLIVADNPDDAISVVGDATFDNYFATDREPLKLTILREPFTTLITVTWPASYPEYNLETSPSLGSDANWQPASAFSDGRNFVHYTDAAAGTTFFRLKR